MMTTLNVIFKPALERFGLHLKLRSKKFPSILNKNSDEKNLFSQLASLCPQDVKTLTLYVNFVIFNLQVCALLSSAIPNNEIKAGQTVTSSIKLPV